MSYYVFGPVPSRRLGRSLGVDLVPFKTCSYDCIYCQLGCTTCKTIERKEWVSLEEVIAGLAERLSSQPDYITLSGSGEPTLFSRVGDLIARIKAVTDIPVAVLTNGSLLWQADVRAELRDADLVIPSLDAGDEHMFQRVNRPHESISFKNMLDGLIDFRREYRGEYWLEILVMEGYTAADDEVFKLARWVKQISPDRVQLNTVTRPPAEDCAKGVSRERLAAIANAFDPVAEVVADFRAVHAQPQFQAGRNEILNLLRRRSCSIEDVAGGLGLHRNEVVKYIEELTADNLLVQKQSDGKLYYQATL